MTIARLPAYGMQHDVCNLHLQKVNELVVAINEGGGGLPGPQGPQGEPGPQGPAGADGAPGPAGADGSQGIQGIQGIQGGSGADGATGPQGAQGIQGPTGADSTVPGPTGPAGDTGAQGIQGIQGVQGIPGPAGNDGATGATGAQGIQGIQGIQGATGDTGATGANGADGGGISKSAGTSMAAGADLTALVLSGNSGDITGTGLTTVMTVTGVGVGRYRFSCQLIYQTTATGTGIDCAVNHTGTTTQFLAEARNATTGTSATSAAATGAATGATGATYEAQGQRTKNTIIGGGTVSVDAANTDLLCTLEGFFVVSVTGSLEIKLAAESAGLVCRAMQGSSLLLYKLSA